jgi:hypothetical protein
MWTFEQRRCQSTEVQILDDVQLVPPNMVLGSDPACLFYGKQDFSAEIMQLLSNFSQGVVWSVYCKFGMPQGEIYKPTTESIRGAAPTNQETGNRGTHAQTHSDIQPLCLFLINTRFYGGRF